MFYTFIFKFIHYLTSRRKSRLFGWICVGALKLLGLEIPKSVKIGENVVFAHGAPGLVIHPYTEIEANVQIFQGVTFGRADSYLSFEKSKMEGILIKDGAMICAGAKVLCKKGILEVGKNTIIGANSVLLQSTGDNEIWAGVPAKKIRDRRVDEF